ncbi:Hint domain-containing protein [Sulfitobacter sp. HNIBRBA3233]|uniref:Hint domain-containing protein n=1 Tax=Sulfitobacter marinivivus TaxID=3158558 RepID=UPI0032DF2B09
MATVFDVFYLGTGPSIDQTEGDFISENSGALVGQTYGSVAAPLVNNIGSLSPGSTGFAGGDANRYDTNNDVSNDTFRIDGGADQTVDGLAIYNATITYTDGTTDTITAVVMQDTAGNLYLLPETSFNSDQAALEAKPIRSLTLNSVFSNNTSMDATRYAANYAVCYAPGTLIETPEGPRAVETLRPGDRVMTLDHGPQAVRWTRSGDHPLENADEDAAPVQIKAGALGPNMPAANLILSPQHRLLVGGGGPLGEVFSTEVFVPAKSLTALPGIRRMKGKARITWIHFACQRHEIVMANGCPSESLLLGPMVMNGLSDAERQAVTELFGPALPANGALNGPPARECLTVGAVRRRLAKHLKAAGATLSKAVPKADRDLAMDSFKAESIRHMPQHRTAIRRGMNEIPNPG